MNGPVRIHERLLGIGARAQNRTARYVWAPLRRWRSFILADAVGTGKSYIALSIALGHFIKRARRPFRVLVLAAPTELSDSWLQKLAGRATESGSIGHLAKSAGPDSFRDLYWARSRPPEFVTYQLRSRREVRALAEILKSDETDARTRGILTPGVTGKFGRVEMLITSPKYVLRLTRKGSERQWRRWIANVDFVIADEVFGAKNPDTAYGRLLREERFRLWPGSRPPLLGLSATLLSRDLPDAESVLEMALQWGRKTGARKNLSSKLSTQLSSFRTALRTGLRNPTNHTVREYQDVVMKLERLLKVVLVRALPKRQRRIRFWTAGHGAFEGFHGVDVAAFPAADVVEHVINPLREAVAAAPKTAEHLAWFLRRAPYAVSDRVSSKDYQCWTAVTESPSARERNPAGHPKISSFRDWLTSYYAEAERTWLSSSPGPYRFKLLVYVHHVKTAGRLNPRELRSFGRSMQKELDVRIRRTCDQLAKQLPDLFKDGDLTRPLGRTGTLFEAAGSMPAKLRLRNPTLLLAALLNAKKSRGSRFAALRRTLGTEKRPPVNYGQLLLQRSTILKKSFFLNERRLLSYDTNRPKKARSLTAALLTPDVLAADLHAQLDAAIAVSKDTFVDLVFRKPSKESSRRLREIGLKARAIFDEDPRWRALTERANQSPKKTLRSLVSRTLPADVTHREPTSVATLTGGDSTNRNFITRRFCEPGNPFVLVLTHVCQIGIDLHPFCWDVLHYSPAWTPHEAEQKTGRIDRPRLPRTLRQLNVGEPRTKQGIRVHHLIWPFTYDERILSRLNVRAQYAERLLGAKDTHDSADERAQSLSRFKPLSLEARGPS